MATSVYMPNGRGLNQTWITLYQRTKDGWSALPFQPHDWTEPMSNAPNLRPTILKNYGAQDPLKTLRLDIRMERVRVNWADRDFHSENIDVPGRSTSVDRTYIPLFERYRASDSASVRAAAEFRLANLTGQPNLRFLIDTIETGSVEEIRREAVGILAPYMDQRFAAEGRPAEEADRETLIVTALDPGSARAGGLRSVPERSAVASVRTWKEFGLVELRFGEGPRGQSGYSMLFRQDQGRWVFVCLMKGWIS